ncbi:MAG: hypothetical protein JWR89_4347, partial [Tardiphaga sp.]|nr:hypothetical protein [Tardiphaga sp.]
RQRMLAPAGTEEKNVHGDCQTGLREEAQGLPAGAARRNISDGVVDIVLHHPSDPAMISRKVATCRANAPRPAAVAVTVVCGFLPTNAFVTAT